MLYIDARGLQLPQQEDDEPISGGKTKGKKNDRILLNARGYLLINFRCLYPKSNGESSLPFYLELNGTIGGVWSAHVSVPLHHAWEGATYMLVPLQNQTTNMTATVSVHWPPKTNSALSARHAYHLLLKKQVHALRRGQPTRAPRDEARWRGANDCSTNYLGHLRPQDLQHCPLTSLFTGRMMVPASLVSPRGEIVTWRKVLAIEQWKCPQLHAHATPHGFLFIHNSFLFDLVNSISYVRIPRLTLLSKVIINYVLFDHLSWMIPTP